MMVKYSYCELLCELSEKSYLMFNTFSMNEEYVCEKIYNEIKKSVPFTADMFILNKTLFNQWMLNMSPKTEDFSYLDTILIGFLKRAPDFAEMYNDDITNINHLTNFLIRCWKNKTKTLKQNLSMLNMIYYRFIRFLNSNKGQDFLYSNSLELYPESEQLDAGIYYEDKAFYQETEYRWTQLAKCKKELILANCNSAVENIEMIALWDATFNSEKFNYNIAAQYVRKFIGETKICRTKLYNSLKRLQVVMLKSLLNDGFLDKYFESDTGYMIGGECHSLRSAIEMWLEEAEIEYNKIRYNGKHITKAALVDGIERYTDMKKYVKSTCSNSKVMYKLKVDADGNTHKSWKMYIFKSGGYIDFSTGRKGFITDLIPESFFRFSTVSK